MVGGSGVAWLSGEEGDALVFFQDMRKGEAVSGFLALHSLVFDEPPVGLGFGCLAGAWVMSRHVEALSDLAPRSDGRSEGRIFRGDLAELSGQLFYIRARRGVGRCRASQQPRSAPPVRISVLFQSMLTVTAPKP